MKALTTKQQRFVDAYDGNATEAARIAGYKKPEIQGFENLRKPNIAAAIESRETERNKSTILTREQRQEFWSKVVRGEEGDRGNINARLKASELLGKSQCDFIEKRENKHQFIGADGKPMKMSININFVDPGKK